MRDLETKKLGRKEGGAKDGGNVLSMMESFREYSGE